MKCLCWKQMKANVRDETVFICPICDIWVDTENKYEYIKNIKKNKFYMFIDKNRENETYETIERKKISYPTVGFVVWFHSDYPTISWKDIAYRSITPFWDEDSWRRSYCEIDLIEIEEWDIPEIYKKYNCKKALTFWLDLIK